ncbi:MAG: hypothetical protein ACR2O3_09740, partial [Rhizobiaceae bacterium]
MKKCFDCGKELSWVPSSGCLNSDQWDAIKAGDFFAPCSEAEHPSGNCYFHDTRGVSTLKRLTD